MSAPTAPATGTTNDQAAPATPAGRAGFPTPPARRPRWLRTVLLRVPFGVVVASFLLAFVTVMTYIPSCNGDRVTHRTTVSGVELLDGKLDRHHQTVPELSRSVAAGRPAAQAALAIALVALALTLLLLRWSYLPAAVGGLATAVALIELQQRLGSGTNVAVHDEAGFTAAFCAALVALVAGVCLIPWRRRELEPYARGAGFWRRLLAWSIDLVAGVAVIALVSGWSPALATLGMLGFLLAYWPLMEHSRWHATLGKLALGLVVLDEEGAGISLRRCVARHLLRWLSIISLVGAMLAGWTPRRQALHDLITDTVVVRTA